MLETPGMVHREMKLTCERCGSSDGEVIAGVLLCHCGASRILRSFPTGGYELDLSQFVPTTKALFGSTAQKDYVFEFSDGKLHVCTQECLADPDGPEIETLDDAIRVAENLKKGWDGR